MNREVIIQKLIINKNNSLKKIYQERKVTRKGQQLIVMNELIK